MSVRHRVTSFIPRLFVGASFLCMMVSPLAAQNAAPPAAPAQATGTAGFERIVLTAGRSTVLNTAFDVTRIAITNPAVADAVVVQPRELLIDGKSAGTVSLIVWGGAERRQYDIVVDPGVTALQQTFQQLFPGEDLRVSMNDESIILTGNVSSNAVMLRAGEIAEGMSSKTSVVNLLQLPGGSGSQQVMLQVRIAEVNRKAVQELGVNFFSTRPDATGRVTTQQFAAPDFDDDKAGGLNFGDFLNLFFFNRTEGLGVAIKALEQKGLFQSLAEPNLIAYNGQEASFLAGGEFPVPVVQGSGNAANVTIIFKEFGVRLNFKPTIAGDSIRLKVRPEVSIARLQQWRHAPGLPDTGAHHAPRRDRRGAARWAVVRDRRPDEQHHAERRRQRPVPEQDSDHRLPVQEQGRAEGAHRADGAGHAAPGAADESG